MKKGKINQRFLIESIKYLIFGALNVLVNILSYKFFSTYLWGPLGSNTAAFLLSVLYAYFTNSLFVFHIPLGWRRFREFFVMRISMIIVDNGGLLLLLWLNINDVIAKCIINIVVIGLNYIFSKVFIFKKKQGDTKDTI